MFSRRHPFLFFTLVWSAIVAVVLLGLTGLAVIGFGDGEFDFNDKVGVVDITGIIVDARPILSQLKRLRNEDSVRAILLRIDSPGGVVGPSQEIYREVVKTRQTKKVIASMGAVAASGGYYVAAAADGIMANRGTITGSIGVILRYTNYQKLLEKIGLLPVVIKSGALKDVGSPTREMTESERAVLESFIKTLHHQFIDDVATGRQMDTTEVTALADGRIFTGETAKASGLVDRIGNFADAVQWAGELGGIEGEPETVNLGEEDRTLFDSILGSLTRALARHDHAQPVAGYLYSPPVSAQASGTAMR